MRLKIIVGNVIVLLLLCIGVFVVVRTGLDDDREERLDASAELAGPLMERSFGFSALELVEAVRDRSETASVRGVFTAIDPERRRARGLSAANDVIRWFHDPARGRDGQPEVVIITDRAGAVLARDSSVNLVPEANLLSALPTLREVLESGGARHDLWDREESGLLLEVGMAPIRAADGSILGALVVGYDLSNGVAEAHSAILGHDVAFTTERGVYSSSLEGSELSELDTVLQSGGSGEGFQGSLSSREVRGVLGSLPMSSASTLGFVIIIDAASAGAEAGILSSLPILGALGILAMVVLGFVIAAGFLRPIEEIEETLLLAMNGEGEARVDVQSPELGGLSYRVNQLIDELADATGEAHSNEDDWQDVREDSQRVSVPASPPEGPEDPAGADESEPQV